MVEDRVEPREVGAIHPVKRGERPRQAGWTMNCPYHHDIVDFVQRLKELVEGAQGVERC